MIDVPAIDVIHKMIQLNLHPIKNKDKVTLLARWVVLAKRNNDGIIPVRIPMSDICFRYFWE